MVRVLLSSLLAVLFSVAAHAHAYLEKSTPADKSVLTTAPTTLALSFTDPVRLTALTIQKGQGKDQGKSQPLGPLPDKPAATMSIPVSNLTPGEYVVSWRAVSDDAHVMSGKIHFTLGVK